MIKVAILGAGGHGKDIKDIIDSTSDYVFTGFYDDNASGPHILGTFFDYYQTTDIQYVIGVNDSSERARIDSEIPDRLRTADPIVHPTAYTGSNVALDRGVVIGAGAVLTTNVSVGRHAHVNVNATISQNSSIGNYSTVSPGANICGDCKIDDRTMIGAGATVINLMNIGSDCIIGAGATVVSHIPDSSKAVGTPARLI